jgi:hypothetical protein
VAFRHSGVKWNETETPRQLAMAQLQAAWAEPAKAVIRLWHSCCTLNANWDFSAQLENWRCRDMYFELGTAVSVALNYLEFSMKFSPAPHSPFSGSGLQ